MFKPGQTLPLTAIFLTCFMMLMLVVSHYPLGHLDLSLMEQVQGRGSEFLLWFMLLVSQPGYLVPALVLAIAAVLFIITSPLRIALLPLVLIVPADISSIMVKEFINRPRPNSLVASVHHFLTDPGFPSSHVVHYTVFFGFMAFFFWHARFLPKPARLLLSACCVSLVLLVSLSRMYLGAHWPTDVVGGYLLGGAFLVLQIRIFQKLALAKS
jgi:membrane-associated phospholipid phosphatase